jgi:ferric-dicitrate binding protein FerR (iron transport regulator)
LTAKELYEDLAHIAKGLPLYVPSKKRSLRPRFAAAAAVLILFLSIYLLWPAKQSLSHADLTEVKVPGSLKKQIRLADGSQVWINSGSSLSYPLSFKGNTREVSLSGEAYFDISHDPNKPFIIHTGELTTTVLGTAFDIKEDKKLHTVIITVTRGKVSVSRGNRNLGILTPNEQISFNTVSRRAIKRAVDAQQAIAWQKIDLQFDNTSFEDAAKQLEQRYQVKIRFANEKVKNCHFTGASLIGESLDKLLKTMCDFNQATYHVQADGSILIDGQGCE